MRLGSLLLTLLLMGSCALSQDTQTQPSKSDGRRQASYPDELRGSGISGTVVLKVKVDPSGRPITVSVRKKVHPRLDEVAVEAVKTWRFHTPVKNGRPIGVTVTIEVNFKETP